MADVMVRLLRFMDREDAERVAEDIRADGEVRYTASTGEQLAAAVGNVTVENA